MTDSQAPPVPAYIVEQVAAAAAQTYPLDYQQVDLKNYYALIILNNPQYVQVSHAERLARVMYLYHQTQQNGGIYLDIQPLSKQEGTETARVMFAVDNHFPAWLLYKCLRCLSKYWGKTRLYRHHEQWRISNLFSTFYVNPRDGVLLEKGNARFRELQNELYNTQIMSSSINQL